MSLQTYYLRVAEELAQAATNLYKALAAGDRDAIEEAARPLFGLGEALTHRVRHFPDFGDMMPREKAKVIAEDATKKLLPISKVFANEPVGDLGEGINLHPGIPKETALAVRLRSGDRCEECRRPLNVGEMHHKHYRTKGREGPEDLEHLCRDCHQAAHETPDGYVSDPELAERLRARAKKK
jgi:hypothetical protein